MKRAKFGAMEAGTIFNDGSRNFIKLKNTYASGLPRVFTHTIKSRAFCGERGNLEFNSIDFDGDPANCPDWVEFSLGLLKKKRA
jgi:hypothetical protein